MEYSSKMKKRSTDLMFVLGLNETKNHLDMAVFVCLFMC